MLDDEAMRDYMPDLKACGLDHLAVVVTKVCQKYLGLRTDNITWCRNADEDLCGDRMDFIMGRGSFCTPDDSKGEGRMEEDNNGFPTGKT